MSEVAHNVLGDDLRREQRRRATAWKQRTTTLSEAARAAAPWNFVAPGSATEVGLARAGLQDVIVGQVSPAED